MMAAKWAMALMTSSAIWADDAAVSKKSSSVNTAVTEKTAVVAQALPEASEVTLASSALTATSSENTLVVSAFRNPFLSQAPRSVAADNISLDDATFEPDTLVDLIENATGVAANGQGGVFQTYSIRGVSRRRVRTLIDGVPIFSERRAGVAASFIDPRLINSVDIVRGPVSTFYGSGALGGAVNIYLGQPPIDSASVGFQAQGNSWFATATSSYETGSISISHRGFGETEAPSGEVLNDDFDMSNFLWRQQFKTDEVDYDILLLNSQMGDIGKSNRRFPNERITNYADEQHTLLKVSASSENNWAASVFFHPNELVTDNIRPGVDITSTLNEAFEFGGNFQKQWFFDSTRSQGVQLGVDWNQRDNVKAIETTTSLLDQLSLESIVFNQGELVDLGMYLSVQLALADQGLFHLGTRYNWQQQSAAGFRSVRDEALSGFVGLDWQWSEQWKTFANLATGFRFPSLSERFFSGTTGRGSVIGDPNLSAEHSANIDLGWRYTTDSHILENRIFRMDVDNYIERITLDSGANAFRNLIEGRIEGTELEYQYRIQAHQFSATHSRFLGRDDRGRFLADIPADRWNLGYQFSSDKWRVQANWQARRTKNQFGDGEEALAATDIVTLRCRYQLSESWQVDAFIDNLLDKSFRATADDLETTATGRNVGLSFTWQGQ